MHFLLLFEQTWMKILNTLITICTSYNDAFIRDSAIYSILHQS
jgi:hypothetical protein